MSSTNLNFFLNLKKIRNLNKLSISELSKKIKINKRTIESYEFRNSFPTFNNLYKIAKFYGITIDFLLLGKKSKFIRNINLYKLAELLDKELLQDMGKVENYIDTFLDRRKKSNLYFDKLNYNFKNNFNYNFSLLQKEHKLTAKELSNQLNLTVNQISGYKKKFECSYDTLIKISEVFHISIHWLITGEKLFFNIKNDNFKNIILKADEYLEKEHIDTTIKIMEQILKNNK